MNKIQYNILLAVTSFLILKYLNPQESTLKLSYILYYLTTCNL